MATKKVIGYTRTPTVVDTKEIEVYQKQIASAAKFSTTLTVRTDDDYKAALIEGKDIKEKLDAIKSRKEAITKPLNESLKSVRALFKPIEEAGQSALTAIKAKMLDYTARKDAKAEEDKRKLAERVERGTMKPETAVAKMADIAPQEKTVETAEAMATTKTVRKVRFVDLRSLTGNELRALVDGGYVVWNEVKARRDALAGDPIRGVEVYEDKELSIA